MTVLCRHEVFVGRKTRAASNNNNNNQDRSTKQKKCATNTTTNKQPKPGDDVCAFCLGGQRDAANGPFKIITSNLLCRGQ